MIPLLSILIPAIPSRIGEAANLFDELVDQADGHPVEVLMLTDNKTRSVGEKRNALLLLSRGQYVSFVDDDDGVSPDYVESICNAIAENPADVICFPIRCFYENEPPVVITYDLNHPNDDFHAPNPKRQPHHLMAWRGDLARRFKFSDKQYGEDADWQNQILLHAKTQAHIDKVLYTYRWSAKTTEAK